MSEAAAPDKVHPNLKLISHSSRLTLHSCEKKYQLNKMLWRQREESLHLDFGKVVGAGIQELMISGSRDRAYFEVFRSWNLDLDNTDMIRSKKTFTYALVALDKFIEEQHGYFANYEVMYFEGKPAAELGFCIDCGGGFKERGFVDLVLRHKITGDVVVLEIKTTTQSAAEAKYKNSFQALGYSVILDTILARLGLPAKSSYKVIYPVWLADKQEWHILDFIKTHTSRAFWIKNLLLDIDAIKRYSEMDYFPMRGESCFAFNKPCTHFGLCEMRADLLAMNGEIQEDPADKYQFHYSLEEIIVKQIEKSQAAE